MPDNRMTVDGAENLNDETTIEEETGGHNILIACFTGFDHTDGEIDTAIQGGGPYGALGDPLEGADIYARKAAQAEEGRSICSIQN